MFEDGGEPIEEEILIKAEETGAQFLRSIRMNGYVGFIRAEALLSL